MSKGVAPVFRWHENSHWARSAQGVAPWIVVTCPSGLFPTRSMRTLEIGGLAHEQSVIPRPLARSSQLTSTAPPLIWTQPVAAPAGATQRTTASTRRFLKERNVGTARTRVKLPPQPAKE